MGVWCSNIGIQMSCDGFDAVESGVDVSIPTLEHWTPVMFPFVWFNNHLDAILMCLWCYMMAWLCPHSKQSGPISINTSAQMFNPNRLDLTSGLNTQLTYHNLRAWIQWMQLEIVWQIWHRVESVLSHDVSMLMMMGVLEWICRIYSPFKHHAALTSALWAFMSLMFCYLFCQWSGASISCHVIICYVLKVYSTFTCGLIWFWQHI